MLGTLHPTSGFEGVGKVELFACLLQVETEGILTADIIRLKLRWTSPFVSSCGLDHLRRFPAWRWWPPVPGQQLKQHEEAAAKAKLAAGQKEALIGATVM